MEVGDRVRIVEDSPYARQELERHCGGYGFAEIRQFGKLGYIIRIECNGVGGERRYQVEREPGSGDNHIAFWPGNLLEQQPPNLRKGDIVKTRNSGIGTVLDWDGKPDDRQILVFATIGEIWLPRDELELVPRELLQQIADKMNQENPDGWEAEPVITLGKLIDLKTNLRGVPLKFKRSDYRGDEAYMKASRLLKELMDSLEVEDYPMKVDIWKEAVSYIDPHDFPSKCFGPLHAMWVVPKAVTYDTPEKQLVFYKTCELRAMLSIGRRITELETKWDKFEESLAK